MDSILITSLLLGIPVGYLVKALLLQEKDSHEGPFLFKNRYIMFPDTGHIQRAGLFDVIRLIGGAYQRESDTQNAWIVDAQGSQRWTCPFCLSFWLCFFFSVPLILHHGNPWYAVPAHLAMCVAATLTARKLDE